LRYFPSCGGTLVRGKNTPRTAPVAIPIAAPRRTLLALTLEQRPGTLNPESVPEGSAQTVRGIMVIRNR